MRLRSRLLRKILVGRQLRETPYQGNRVLLWLIPPRCFGQRPHRLRGDAAPQCLVKRCGLTASKVPSRKRHGSEDYP